VTRLPTILVVLVFAGSLALTLGASIVFARRLDRLGSRLGWPEALVGLLTATAADAPELSSAVIAIAHGSGAVGVGVVVGSNLFNLAAMVGAVALVARWPIRIGRRELVQEAGVALAVTAAATLVLAGALPAWIGLAACGVAAFLYTEGLDIPLRPPGSLRTRARAVGIAALELPAIALVAIGSLGMVNAALVLADRWGVSDAVVGMVILAWLTSLPNALTAFRLGLAGRGDALVSETLHSNSINMVGGLVIPALFVTITGVSAGGLALLFGLTALTLAPLARHGSLGRRGGAAIVIAYAAAAAVLVSGGA
jgi:cation:H+ antiporter